jgi:hypothetical protein
MVIVFILIPVFVLILLLWNIVVDVVKSKKDGNMGKTSVTKSGILFIIIPVLAFFCYLIFPYYESPAVQLTGMDFFEGSYPLLDEAARLYTMIASYLFLLCCVDALLSYKENSITLHVILGLLMLLPIVFLNLNVTFYGLFQHHGMGYNLYLFFIVLYLLVACLKKPIDKIGSKSTDNVVHKGGYCAHCGKPLSEEQSFCPYCGTKRNNN